MKPKQMTLLYAAEQAARSKDAFQNRVRERVDILTTELMELVVKPEAKYCISSPKDAYDILRPMGMLEVEELWVVSLNARNRVKSVDKIYQGSTNSSQVRVGELFRVPLLYQAVAIVVAHNHPSGDPTPSPDDVAITRAIHQAGKLLDVDLLDHLIVVHDRFVSMKERGLGF